MDTDNKQTDADNLAKTGQTEAASSSAGTKPAADPAQTKPAAETQTTRTVPPAQGSITGDVGKGDVIDQKTAHGEVRGPARDYHEQNQNQPALGVNSIDGRKSQIERTNKHLESLEEKNAEGHDKAQDRIRKDAEAAHANTKRGPTSGKELNRNTPVIDADGNKHWVD